MRNARFAFIFTQQNFINSGYNHTKQPQPPKMPNSTFLTIILWKCQVFWEIQSPVTSRGVTAVHEHQLHHIGGHLRTSDDAVHNGSIISLQGLSFHLNIGEQSL